MGAEGSTKCPGNTAVDENTQQYRSTHAEQYEEEDGQTHGQAHVNCRHGNNKCVLSQEIGGGSEGEGPNITF